MSDVFLSVLNTSIAASWVVLGVLAARLVLRRAPRNIVCALWTLVGARLMYRRFFKSPFSLIPSLETITPESMYDRSPVITSGVPIIDNVVNPIYTQSFATDGVASVNPLQIWTAITANIWLLGMIAIWLWAIISWLRIRRRVAPSVNLRDNIYLCDGIDTPFIFGVFSPKIYLPSSLDEPQRSHVIAHEQAHIRRMDFYYKPWAYFLLSLHWFNPVLWVAYTLLCRDIELACDELVIKQMSAEEKKGYSTALLECSVHRHMIAACPLAFGEMGVKERIKAVLHYKKPAFWLVAIAAVLTVVLGLGFLTDPVERSAEIRYNSALYVLEQQEVSFLPIEDETVGSLRSILHDTTGHPTEEFQATNLDESLAGCPLYLENDRLYLQKMDGTCMAFRLKQPNDLVSDYASMFNAYRWSVFTGTTVETEEIISDTDRTNAYAQILDSLRDVSFSAGPAGGTLVLRLDVDKSGDFSGGLSLALYDSGQWELTAHTASFAGSVYTFESLELDAWAAPLVSRAEYFASVFDDDPATEIGYHTLSSPPLELTFGLPTDWEYENLNREILPDYLAFRYRPAGLSGGISVYYYPDGAEISLPGGIPLGTQNDFTYPTGLSGTEIIPNGSEVPSMMVFDTESGTLFAITVDLETWPTDLSKNAAMLLGGLDVRYGGQNILCEPNKLGIHLSVEGVTSSGLTLLCTQDGTVWSSIYTGRDFSIARWEEAENEWVFLPMAENTAWTMEAYGVPQGETTRTNLNWTWVYGELGPGQYRIYKGYSGERGPITNREEVSQTYYAEFTIK